ncbi:hypothetical protein CFC21_017677, partial [Triticum aestivum]
GLHPAVHKHIKSFGRRGLRASTYG